MNKKRWVMMHPAGLVRLLGCLRTEYQSQFILVPRAHDPSGLWQESRALAGPDFLSMRRVLVSYYQPIRFARFDGKSVNRGLPVLDKDRALDSCHRPEAGIVGLGDENGPNSESSPSIKTRSLHTIFAGTNLTANSNEVGNTGQGLTKKLLLIKAFQETSCKNLSKKFKLV